MNDYEVRITEVKRRINEIVWMYCDADMTLHDAEKRASRAFIVITGENGVTQKGGK